MARVFAALILLVTLLAHSAARAQTVPLASPPVAEVAPPPQNDAAPAPTNKPRVVMISGQLFEKGTKKPLPEVNVYCFTPPENPVPDKAVTDTKGHFTISVPLGVLHRWKVSLANYRVYDQTDKKIETVVTAKKIYIEKESYLVYETTIIGDQDKRDDKTQSLTQDQFMTLPGANGDPVKAVQNLVGVNRANAFSSQVIIEGSSPSDTRYNIDDQPVPIIFHFGGLDSVVMPEAIDRVDYLSAGFGPEYGGTTAGLVNLDTRPPKEDRSHGMAFVDIYHAGAMYETQINDHSTFLIGARKSYIGEVLKLVSKGNSDFDLTVAPDFDDLIMMYQNKLSAHDTFKLVSVGSIDTLAFVTSQPPSQDPSIRGNFSDTQAFYRVIPEYTHKFDDGKIGRLSLGLGQDVSDADIGNLYIHDHDVVASARAEVEVQMRPSWKTYFGVDNELTLSTVAYQIPFTPGAQSGGGGLIAGASLQTISDNFNEDMAGIYWRNVLHSDSSRWTFLPGLRLAYDSLVGEFLPEPRVGARYALDNKLTLRAAVGMYDEAPPAQDLDGTFGNPNLTMQKAVHYTLGFEKDFRHEDNSGWWLSTDAFYKYLYDLVNTTSALNASGQPEYYNSDGTGEVYGAEVMLKYQSHKWSGWLAYTLSRSTRTYPPNSEQLFAYDQTHNLILVGERAFGHNWKFSGRARYTTGDPYTPVTAASYDADNDVYVPQYAAAYSSRLPSFFEVDVRFDKEWVMNTWTLTFYVDVENATNSKNVQQINYSYNYQQTAEISALPILPTVGIKGEF